MKLPEENGERRKALNKMKSDFCACLDCASAFLWHDKITLKSTCYKRRKRLAAKTQEESQ